MNSGFKVHDNRGAGVDSCERVRSVASTQYYEGEIVKVIAGFAEKVAAGDKGTHMVEHMITPDDVLQMAVENKSTALCEFLLVKKINGGFTKMRSRITPLYTTKALIANGNALATEIVFTDAAVANGALVGGTVYINETDEQRTITADVKAGNDHTLTISPALAGVYGVGKTIRLVPFSKGKTAVKFDATLLGRAIGCAVADATGGHNAIEGVTLSDYPYGCPVVMTTIPDLE